MMKKTLLAMLAISASLSSNILMAETLTTKNYIVEIKNNCIEGVVQCDEVIYIGTSKRSGQSIELIGRTQHSKCADGITPCRLLGYIFENGNVFYHIDAAGVLRVTKGDSILLEEMGEWSY